MPHPLPRACPRRPDCLVQAPGFHQSQRASTTRATAVLLDGLDLFTPTFAPCLLGCPGTPRHHLASAARIDKLGGADVYSQANAYELVESLRIDYGHLGPFGIHP
jgi:hypothetical protein